VKLDGLVLPIVLAATFDAALAAIFAVPTVRFLNLRRCAGPPLYIYLLQRQDASRLITGLMKAGARM
jgi:hypothetical protein